MFRINKRNHRKYDREHGKTIDVKNLSLYRWVKYKSISREFFLVKENIKEKKKMKFLLKQ